MSGVEKFEDLECWAEAKELVLFIYDLTRNSAFSHDFGLKDQIRRASVSSMTNIAEGFARYSNKDFIWFLNVAQSSCEEVKSLLYVAESQGYINQEEFGIGYSKASEVRYMCLGFMRYLNSCTRGNEN